LRKVESESVKIRCEDLLIWWRTSKGGPTNEDHVRLVFNVETILYIISHLTFQV